MVDAHLKINGAGDEVVQKVAGAERKQTAGSVFRVDQVYRTQVNIRHVG